MRSFAHGVGGERAAPSVTADEPPLTLMFVVCLPSALCLLPASPPAFSRPVRVPLPSSREHGAVAKSLSSHVPFLSRRERERVREVPPPPAVPLFSLSLVSSTPSPTLSRWAHDETDPFLATTSAPRLLGLSGLSLLHNFTVRLLRPSLTAPGRPRPNRRLKQPAPATLAPSRPLLRTPNSFLEAWPRSHRHTPTTPRRFVPAQVLLAGPRTRPPFVVPTSQPAAPIIVFSHPPASQPRGALSGLVDPPPLSRSPLPPLSPQPRPSHTHPNP